MALFPKDQGLLQRDLSLVNFGFRWHFFNLNTALIFLGQYVCMEENNLQFSLALYISLAFNKLEPYYVLSMKQGGAVSWWLTPRTPDPEVGGSSPTRIAVLCP